ncbi:hypothetical protein PAHAL_7G282500 [Panicum hallii]|jgi:hypothetical protein|uniref:Uncharacterized protein n=1 Tax=Panicum hallii TaxID=206008 RepID=A0A2T8IDQ7_9POAL|nr:hypothetical protein PAHAL_7G282500 [Panicum hallii]
MVWYYRTSSTVYYKMLEVRDEPEANIPRRNTVPVRCAAVPVCVQMEQSKLAAPLSLSRLGATVALNYELGAPRQRQPTNKGAPANVLVPPSTRTPVAGNHAGRACRRQPQFPIVLSSTPFRGSASQARIFLRSNISPSQSSATRRI